MTAERIIWGVALIVAVVFGIEASSIFLPAVPTQGRIIGIRHSIDTLRQEIRIHDTLERFHRARIDTLLESDTILKHDTVAMEIITECKTALDECDKSKRLRDTIIYKTDTLAQVVHDSVVVASVKQNIVVGVASAILSALLCVIFLR